MRAYQHFSFKGRNCEKVLAKLARNKIPVYFVSKTAPDNMLFAVEHKDGHKVFAIFDGACYNIRSIKYSGALYPFLYLLKNKGIIIGAALFLAVCIICASFVFGIRIEGDSVYGREIERILEEKGVRAFSLFSDIDTEGIESEILKLEGVGFVSARRSGARFVVDARMTGASAAPERRLYTDLVAPADAAVVSVTVLRGTALIQEGDSVTAGQALVGAYAVTANEEKVPTFVIARIELEVIAKIKFYTPLSDAKAKNAAAAYAKFVLGGKELISCSVTESAAENGCLIADCRYIELIIGG